MFSFFALPTNILDGLGDSQESLEICSASSDVDCTSEEEISSGYQTSDARSPQLGQVEKQQKSYWKIPQTNLVYHCSDLFRKNLFIAKIGGNLEAVKTSKDGEKYVFYVDLEALDHYDNGASFHIVKKFSLLINSQIHEERVTGFVNLTPSEINLNGKVCEEFVNMSKLKESLSDCGEPAWEEATELWTQRKIKKDRGQNSNKHPLREIINHTFLSSQRKSHGVNIKLDDTEVRILFNDQNNHPVIATKLKLNGTFRKPNISAEFEGSASVECIIYNESINRWEHLLQAKDNSGKSLNFQVFSGSFDLSPESAEGRDDIPIHSELSIDDLLSGECADSEEKLKIFLNNYVLR